VAGDGDEVHHNLRLACRDSGKCVSVGGSGGAGGGGGDISGVVAVIMVVEGRRSWRW